MAHSARRRAAVTGRKSSSGVKQRLQDGRQALERRAGRRPSPVSAARPPQQLAEEGVEARDSELRRTEVQIRRERLEELRQNLAAPGRAGKSAKLASTAQPGTRQALKLRPCRRKLAQIVKVSNRTITQYRSTPSVCRVETWGRGAAE